MRITTLVFTVLVTIYAVYSDATIFRMVEDAYQITLVMAFIPLVCGIYWKKATNQGALLAIAMGVSTWIGVLGLGPEDPFVPAHLAGLLASAAGMIVGSLMPQFIPHDEEIHDLLRSGQHAAARSQHAKAGTPE